MKKMVALLLAIISSSYLLGSQNVSKSAVLVTGGAGYIGSHIAHLLAQHNYQVIVIDHKIKKQFPWATYYTADYADESTLAEIFTTYNIECVFHCAAHAIVPESYTKALEFYDNNFAKTIALLSVMRQYNVKRIIFASSRSIYGDAQFTPITEDHPKNPLSPYARTKWFTEQILEDLHRAYGLEYVAIRFVNAVGAMPEYGLGEDHDPETHVFPLVLQAAKYKRTFKIYGTDHKTHDGTCVRTYIHVQDIAQANYLALEYLKNGGESTVFQLGSPAVLSIKEMVKAVEDYYQTTINTVVLPRRTGDSPELISDYSKVQRVLGWQPTNSTVHNLIESMDQFENLKHSK